MKTKTLFALFPNLSPTHKTFPEANDGNPESNCSLIG